MRNMTALAGGVLVLALVLTGCNGDNSTTIQGPGGRELTLTVPDDVTILRGTSRKVDVEIDRENTREPVTVSIGNLPEGVRARQSSQTVETDAVTFILEADRQADLVYNQAVRVTMEGPEGMRAVQQFSLTVEP